MRYLRTANCRSRLELIELAPGSGLWPCEMAGASAVTLKQPSALGAMAEPQPGGYVPKPKGVYTSPGR